MRRPILDFEHLYRSFDQDIVDLDCGKMCAAHNPSGKPFCCDICEAVPAAYDQEWGYLRKHTDLWDLWHGGECLENANKKSEIEAGLAHHQVLLVCKGPVFCRRQFRAISCRQFPFFPYITADYRFVGLAYDWHFEEKCWVIRHLDRVREDYRRQFIEFYDALFSLWPDEMESYAAQAEEMRSEFLQRKRRIPILHRNGGFYLLSPGTERMRSSVINSN